MSLFFPIFPVYEIFRLIPPAKKKKNDEEKLCNNKKHLRCKEYLSLWGALNQLRQLLAGKFNGGVEVKGQGEEMNGLIIFSYFPVINA